MNNFKEKLQSLKPTKRRLIQLYTALLFNANFKGFSTGNIYQGNTKKMCVPGINCYSCPGAVGACPLGSLQGSFSADKSTIYYVGGILLLYSILFGRMICGWVCPFGLIQELLHKIKTPKLKKNRFTRVLSYLKYVLLVVMVFAIPISYAFKDTPFPAFCKFICPAGTLEGGIGLLSNEANASYFSMLGPLFTWKFMILVIVIVGSIFVFRLFCRFICPLGALYGLFNRISFFGVKIEQPKCINCNLCVKKCKMDIHHVGDQECISCGECIDVCPTNAIIWKGPKLKRKPVETKNKLSYFTRSFTCIAMVGFLIGVIVYYWNDESANLSNNISNEQNAQGNEVGDLCFGADLEIVTPEGIIAETINPIETGKITIINFWGTWCTPCVNELPYFDQIASEHQDTVSVIAIHTNMVSDTASAYISEYYPDSHITFARDLESEGYYSMLGGRGTYPYTVILDSDGTIAKIFFEALEYEDLKEVVEALK